MPDLRRIDREIKQCRLDTESMIAVHPVNDSLVHLKGVFLGPEGTPYEGGSSHFHGRLLIFNGRCFWLVNGRYTDYLCTGIGTHNNNRFFMLNQSGTFIVDIQIPDEYPFRCCSPDLGLQRWCTYPKTEIRHPAIPSQHFFADRTAQLI